MRTGYQFNLYGVEEEEALAWAEEAFGDYGKAQVQSVFRSCYQKTDEHGTRPLPSGRKRAQGTDDKDSPLATVDEIEAFLSTQAEFHYNVITYQYEIRWLNQEKFRQLIDRNTNTLWSRMSKTAGRVNLNDICNVIQSEYAPDFHPFQEYFDTLPAWDGIGDPIADLAATVHVKGDPARFTGYFRKWFVGILPALFEEHVVNHEILVLIGRQGVYKTTWFNYLLPPALRRYFYTKTNSDRLVKDDLFTLTEFALVCLEEIDKMQTAQLNHLKAMNTMTFINERAAYGRYKQRRSHIASLCGTGNNLQFLTDTTGNRRWLPFEVENIDSPYKTAIPYEAVYGQALSLWKSGFQYWFSQEEVNDLNKHNTRFEAPNLEEELINIYFRKPFVDETGIFVNTARILERINAYTRKPLSAVKIGIFMRKLGFEAIRHNGIRGYIVVEMSAEEIQRSMKAVALGLGEGIMKDHPS